VGDGRGPIIAQARNRMCISAELIDPWLVRLAAGARALRPRCPDGTASLGRRRHGYDRAFAMSDSHELLMDTLEECVIFLLEAILVHSRRVENSRRADTLAARHCRARGEMGCSPRQSTRWRVSTASTPSCFLTLVGLGGVSVAVAQDPCAAISAGESPRRSAARGGEHQCHSANGASLGCANRAECANALAHLGAPARAWSSTSSPLTQKVASLCWCVLLPQPSSPSR